MPAFQFVPGALTADRIGAQIFAGDILVFRQIPALKALVRDIDAMVREGLGDAEPETAEVRLAPDLFLARVRALRSQVRAEKSLMQLMGEAVAQVGLPPEDT